MNEYWDEVGEAHYFHLAEFRSVCSWLFRIVEARRELRRNLSIVALVVMASGVSEAGNVVTGDCNALSSHIAQPGVVDNLGQNHPGYVGWTVSDFSYVRFATARPRSRNPRIDVPPPQNCLNAWIRAEFTATSVVSKLEWNPSPPACQQCDCEERAATWQVDLDGHEKRHVQQAEELAAEWTAKWQQPRLFSYCSPAAGQAGRQRLALRIDAALDAEIVALRQEFDRRVQALHNLGLYDIANIDCGKECAGCTPSQPPQLCTAAGQHCSFGMCVQDACCNVVRDWGKSTQSASKSWMSGQKCAELGKAEGVVTMIVANCYCAGTC